jgi:ATP-dependent DNA helicase RecG
VYAEPGSALRWVCPRAWSPTAANLWPPVCRKRAEVRQQLQAGTLDIVIGTTALNNDHELFARLGLVIIDEQHRFGVRQRAQLVKKDPSAPPPHVLFMTATPIPRTIAMTMMSHMTTSIIDELPPGRKPVTCALLPH